MKNVYFQYLNYPIFCELSENCSNLPELLRHIEYYGFKKIKKKEVEKGFKDPSYRVLKINLANARLSKEIGAVLESDKYGPESITPFGDLNHYKFQGRTMIQFSLKQKIWEMVVLEDHGKKEFELYDRIIWVRLLSWSLLPFGIIGIWGRIISDGVFVQRMLEANGNAVFFNLFSESMFLEDLSERKITSPIRCFNLENYLNIPQKRMTNEELYAFLSLKCTYFNYVGSTSWKNDLILKLVGLCDGVKVSNSFFEGYISQHS